MNNKNFDNTESIKVFENENEALQLYKQKLSQYNYHNKYLLFYSSMLGGVVLDPTLMMVPVDDHLVHRGDGVFEAIKTVSGRVYLLDEHLERLFFSLSQLDIKAPFDKSQIRKLILNLCHLAQTKSIETTLSKKDFMIRLYISRGPGGFTTNPYESIGSQLYIMITEFQPYRLSGYTEGVKIGWSQILQKDPFFAKVKSCNYLQNVLMKKESVDRNLDFTISLNKNGYVSESSTENIFIIDQNNNLVTPPLESILSGTVMLRLIERLKFLNTINSTKMITAVFEQNLTPDQVMNAKEVFMAGTTLDVLPVVDIEGQLIGRGHVGPFSKIFNDIIKKDQFDYGIIF